MKLDRTITPPFQPIEAPKYWNVEKKVLKNGIETHLFSKPDELLSSITLVFKGGFHFSEDGLDIGLLKDMILSETLNFSNNTLGEELGFYGAYFQLTSNYNHIEIQCICLNRYLSDVLPLLKEVISNVRFKESDFHIYIEKKKQNFEVSKKKVSFLGRTHFMNQVFGDNHIYGRLRKVEDYNNLELKSVEKYYQTHIQNKTFQLFLTGKFEDSDFSLIERELISNTLEQDLSEKLKRSFSPKEKSFNLVLKDSMQSLVTVGFSCQKSTHPDFLKLKIVNTILGGFFGSRLMKNIREDKGYTYGIGSQLMTHPETGLFKISTEVGSKHVPDTLVQIHLEIDRLKNELISEEELDLVKNYLLGSILSSSDGIMQQAAMYKNLYFQGFDLDRNLEFIDIIKNISAKEIQELSKAFFIKENMFEVVAGVKHEF